MSEIQLTESFNDPHGRYANYDAYDTAARDTILSLEHTDIRVFDNGTTTTAQTVAGLSTLTVTQLNALTMTTINNPSTLIGPEGWTGVIGTAYGPDAANNHMRSLRIPFEIGLGTVRSEMPNNPVDISGYAPTDFISISMLNLPLAGINVATTGIEFTSNPTGDITSSVGRTARIMFLRDSVTTIANGFCEARIPISLVTAGADPAFTLSRITAVRILPDRSASTGGTFVINALRAITADYNPGLYDVDTRYGIFRRTAPLNGNTAAAPAYTQPPLFRSHVPASVENDPRPIDGEAVVIFNTGSKAATNQFTIYMRELAEDFMQMLDLDAMPMTAFDGRVMPDTGDAAYNPRIAGATTEFDNLTQSQMDLETQFSLERRPDLVKALWVYYNVQWTTTGGTVILGVTDSDSYTFTLPNLTANKLYAAICTLEETAARLAIYPIDNTGGLDLANKVFDSTIIDDDSVFKRRKGRFGWSASLGDGDAFIDSITDRGMTYGEYRSLPYESFTPVVGVELFASITPPTQLIESLAPGPFNGVNTVVSKDRARSTTGESWKVQNFGDRPLQGLSSHYFAIKDFENARLTFDIFYPSAVDQVPDVFLLARNSGRTVPLVMPSVKRDQWQSVSINFTNTDNLLGGDYRLVIVQPTTTASTWWVDNLKLYERSVAWDARSTPEDPWGVVPTTWTPFYDNFNRPNTGILFDQRGTRLQVRAKARRQESRIERVQFKPKYAELGRLLWDSDKLTAQQYNPSATWTSAGAGGGTKTVNFSSTATDPDGFIVSWEWSFGDGSTGVGQQVSHKYAALGIYTVTHTVMDNNGNRAFTTNIVSAP